MDLIILSVMWSKLLNLPSNAAQISGGGGGIKMKWFYFILFRDHLEVHPPPL